jgi:hypothetical protein
MFVRIILGLSLVSLAITTLTGLYFKYFSNSLKASPEWIYSVSIYSGMIFVVSLFVAIFAAMIRDKRKSQEPMEECHTFSLKELNDPQFTNDFRNVPGGEEDLVAEDLEKIGIVDKPDEKK